jgi:hypothetical protein
VNTKIQINGRVFTKSSYSVDSPSGMRCVGVSVSENNVLVTNISIPNCPIVKFTHDEWHAFVLGVKNGEFDLK